MLSKIKKVISLLKTDGVGEVLGAVSAHLIPRRPLASFQQCRPYVEEKVGIEIGGPTHLFRKWSSLPIYSIASRVDNCNFSDQTVWVDSIKEGASFRFDDQREPGYQYVVDASNLEQFTTETYDFLLSSHALEHIANPIKALSEWIRVLKQEGLLVLLLPHKDGTFDHRRPLTTLDHLVRDYEMQVTEGDLTHLDEILALHDLKMDRKAGSVDAFKERSLKNKENRCLHHHVFDTRLVIKLVHHIGLQILAVESFKPNNILVIAYKPRTGDIPNNDLFLSEVAPPRWKSPFPSDFL
ncbi:methyltransferase domain-containing protein [Geothrix sp. PMB-07]|uniref:methyltransferase domain-containing protein n=1 Tax=Geothrix sp. PMB-07 TaxID=3068640 RepID=UPI0027417691|nr:methyltransferase domain-containing protein [Geothrix sp. PMB-07]WLT31324.1 methyltransferase domain-containing protein [Geothrix sp. PMB-07]